MCLKITEDNSRMLNDNKSGLQIVDMGIVIHNGDHNGNVFFPFSFVSVVSSLYHGNTIYFAYLIHFRPKFHLRMNQVVSFY